MSATSDLSAQPVASSDSFSASGSASTNRNEPQGKSKKTTVSKGGRPPKDPLEKLTSVTMHVSPRAYAWLVEGARVMEETVSEFARSFVESKMSRRLNKVRKRSSLTLAQENLLTQLANLGNNLNQLTRAANRDGFAVQALEVKDVCDEVRGLLSKMAQS